METYIVGTSLISFDKFARVVVISGFPAPRMVEDRYRCTRTKEQTHSSSLMIKRISLSF